MKTSTFYGKMDNIRKAATNAVGTAIAAPAIIKSKMAINQSTKDTKALKTAREYEGMPNENPDGSFTDGFKARSVAAGVRARLLRGQK